MSKKQVKPPQLPGLPDTLDPQLRAYLETLELKCQIYEGTIAKLTNSRFVTIQDLVSAGVVADGVIK